MTDQTKLTTLGLLCSVLQVAGLVLIVLQNQLPAFTPILIGIAGFAGIVNYFIPGAKGLDKVLRPVAAIAGFGIIMISTTLVV